MITLDEFLERLLRLGADRGPRGFPRRRRDREILMKSILMGLDSGLTYTEPEINEELQRWNETVAPAIRTDHVTVRRHLIDWGYLERTADGGSYRIGFPAGAPAFELEVDDVDLASTVETYREAQRRRPRARPPSD